MKLAFATALILLFILAPVYLLPRILGTDSGESLIEAAASDIAAQVSDLRDVKTITVQPIDGDHRGTLRFALIHALRRDGRTVILEPNESSAKDEHKKSGLSKTQPDVILQGRIERHETLGKEERLTVRAIVVRAQDGKVLWSNTWNDNAKLHGAELEFHKTAIVICLALAAGILVIFARKQDSPRETIREW